MYKIEIWQYHCIVETFEASTLEEVRDWFGEEWRYSFEEGYCTFYVFDPEGNEIDTIEEGFF